MKIKNLRVRPSFVIAGLVIAVAVGYLVFNATKANAEYYMTVDELKSAPSNVYSENLRIGGTVQDGSIKKDPTTQVMSFVITQGNDTLPVTYSGVIPDIFRPGINVVLEGKYTSQHTFAASNMLTQCPSRFTSAPVAPTKTTKS